MSGIGDERVGLLCCFSAFQQGRFYVFTLIKKKELFINNNNNIRGRVGQWVK